MPRAMQWITSYVGFGPLLGSGSQTNVPLYTVADRGPGFIKGSTVTRMVIDIRMRASALAQLVVLNWGILLVDGEAAAVGILPEADDLSERAGWMVRGVLTTIQDSLSDSSQWDRAQMDIRSQRVLRAERDELHLILDAGTTGFALEWHVFIRVLMKLP